jgi:phosphate transport system substrate-binding protein
MGRTHHALITAIAIFALVGCSSRIVPAATPTIQSAPLRLYATTSTIPLVTSLTSAYSRVNPSVMFELVTGNYESVIQQVAQDNDAYFFTNHLPLESLWIAPIGQDGIAVIVHPGNPVRELTTTQLRDIYRGRIDNWHEVGGNDREIVVISREDGSGSRAEFDELVMGDRFTTRLAQIAPSSAAVVRSVARARGAIGYVSMSYLERAVRALSINGITPSIESVFDNTYPLRSIMYIAGAREPTSHFRNFIHWVQSPEGQAIVSRRYAPLLRPQGS